ncbi:sulfate/molybdate ABC transporter ATP-binding protein [Breznakiellaceae bacterium SP9]
MSPRFTLEVQFASTGGEGKCLGILGVSGSGKSMTLKCIAGIETPDEGHIEVNGTVLFDSSKRINLKPQARKVGYLFQNYALFPRMTILQNITVGLPLPTPVAQTKARALLERFELSGLDDRYPATLSGGQAQRAALARMLIREPDVVLLDEPFSALDTNLRELMQVSFPDFLRSCKDVIMVTHSRDEVFRLCSETLIMDKGQCLTMDNTKALFANPGLVQAARLTGCKNISPIKIVSRQEIIALDWGLTLKTAVPVRPEIKEVGIRAHDLVAMTTAQAAFNLVKLSVLTVSEEPFENVVLFRNGAVDPLQGAQAQQTIWWKYSKYMNIAMPEYLFIPPEKLLLLT